MVIDDEDLRRIVTPLLSAATGRSSVVFLLQPPSSCWRRCVVVETSRRRKHQLMTGFKRRPQELDLPLLTKMKSTQNDADLTTELQQEIMGKTSDSRMTQGTGDVGRVEATCFVYFRWEIVDIYWRRVAVQSENTQDREGDLQRRSLSSWRNFWSEICGRNLVDCRR